MVRSNITSTYNNAALIFISFASMMLVSPALAQDAAAVTAAAQSSGFSTLGMTIQKVIEESKPIQIFISALTVVAFLLGVVLVKNGLSTLAKNEEKNAVSSGLVKIFFGGVLISLPTIIMFIIYTIVTQSTTLSPEEMKFYRESGSLSADSYSAMFANFAKDAAGPLTLAVILVSSATGFFMVISAIYRLSQVATPNSPYFEKSGQSLTRLGFGALFMLLPSIIDLSTASFLGNAVMTGSFAVDFTDFTKLQNLLSYSKSTGSFETQEHLKQLLFVMFYGLIPFGLIAFYSGLRSLQQAAEGNQGGQNNGMVGAVKLVAGVLLVNMQYVSCATVATVASNSPVTNIKIFQDMCQAAAG